MRRRLFILAPAAVIAILACGGAATPSTADPAGPSTGTASATPAAATPAATPTDAEAPGTFSSHVLPWLVASSTGPWPMAAQTLTNAVDDDPFTTWKAQAGEVGAFVTPSVTPDLIQAMGTGTVELRLLGKPPRGQRALVGGAWRAVKMDAQRLVYTDLKIDVDEVVGFEVRAPDGAKIAEIRLVADGRPPSPSGPWMYKGSSRTSDAIETVADWKAMRFGTLDIAACTAEKHGGGPGEALTDATCTATKQGVQVKGTFPPFGAIDEEVRVQTIHSCLALVDGYPHTRKGCTKLQ